MYQRRRGQGLDKNKKTATRCYPIAAFVCRFEKTLPSEVGKRLVRIGHAVSVLTFGVGHAFFLVSGD